MTMHNDELPFDIYDINVETDKISDLIFVLKSVFRLNDFKKVEEILTAREERLHDEVNHWKKEYELMEKAHGEVVLSKLEMEVEMNQYQRECYMLTEQITRLNTEKEIYQDKEKVISGEKKFYEEGEKKAQCMYENLMKDVQRLEKDKKELIVKNSELDSTRIKADRELQLYKKKIKEYDLRIAQLEKVMEEIMSKRTEQPVSVGKFGEEKTSANEVPSGIGSGDLTEPKVKKTRSYELKGSGSVTVPVKEGKSISNHTVLGSDSSHRKSKGLTTDAGYKEAGSGNLIEICDSDDEKPLPNQTPRVTDVMSKSIQADDENQCSSSSSKRKRESCFDVRVESNECGHESDGDSNASDIIRRMVEESA